jgi:hypothetical protein
MTKSRLTSPYITKDREVVFTTSFPEIASRLQRNPFDSEYRDFMRSSSSSLSDPIKDWLTRHMPKYLAWSKAERVRKGFDFVAGYPPQELSPFVDRLARGNNCTWRRCHSARTDDCDESTSISDEEFDNSICGCHPVCCSPFADICGVVFRYFDDYDGVCGCTCGVCW